MTSSQYMNMDIVLYSAMDIDIDTDIDIDMEVDATVLANNGNVSHAWSSTR